MLKAEVGCRDLSQMNQYPPIARFIRNTKEDACSVHSIVREVVLNHQQAEWKSLFPPTLPPEGLSARTVAGLPEQLRAELKL